MSRGYLSLKPDLVARQIQKTRLATGRLGSLPQFLLIGAQKCGTTSLFETILQHPQVAKPLVKEVHFFEDPKNYNNGHKWYRAFFPMVPTGQKVITGEATPLMYHRMAPKRVHQLIPNAKLLVVLRNPVKRAFSHYLHNKARNRETLPFDEALAMEMERTTISDLDLELDSTKSRDYRTYNYFQRGMYSEQLGHWLQYFPSKNIHIVIFEELISDTEREMQAVFRFLDLAPHKVKSIPHSNSKLSTEKMSDSSAERLRTQFFDHNRALEELIGRSVPWT